MTRSEVLSSNGNWKGEKGMDLLWGDKIAAEKKIDFVVEVLSVRSSSRMPFIIAFDPRLVEYGAVKCRSIDPLDNRVMRYHDGSDMPCQVIRSFKYFFRQVLNLNANFPFFRQPFFDVTPFMETLSLSSPML